MGNPGSLYHLPKIIDMPSEIARYQKMLDPACTLERILQRHLMVSTQHGKQGFLKRLHVEPIDQLHPSHVPSVVGTATPELVFTITTDAVQWVQIYGFTRRKDANEYIFILFLRKVQH